MEDFDLWNPPEDDRKVAFKCDCCGNDILHNDDYFIVLGDRFCTDCCERETAYAD